MAIEDAVELPRYIMSPRTVEDALESFAKDRYERTTAITKESIQFGRIGQWESKVACWFRDQAVSIMLKFVGESQITKYAKHQVRSRKSSHCENNY